MDPFAAALDAHFIAPGSAAAVYVPQGGAPVPIRVIRSQPDTSANYQQTRVIQQANAFDMRISDVPAPTPGDRIIVGAALIDGAIVGGEAFEILGDPMKDVEGLTWTCGAETPLS
ncbi:hypothetical protein NF699_09600 [Sphingomonadaceae bacterium OTU29LAMAA1]|nr:hypothetical protein NF699_09600 [Sphingomonadaceae bacterium OTU29LAMAA1]